MDRSLPLPPRPTRSILAAALILGAAAASATTYRQPGFSETVVFSGLVEPTAVRFLPDGRVLVAEKSGLLKIFDSLADPTPAMVADLRTQVHNFWDRGMFGLAIDPDFAENGFVYVLYAHDAYIGGTAPLWGPGDGTSDPCPTPPGPTTDGCVVSGRLSRLFAAGAEWTASEHVLIEGWCQQFSSHSMGSLAFGADGYLYVTAGDGASFDNQDWGQFGGTEGVPPPTAANPCGDPPFPIGTPQTRPTAEGGALRSQSPRRAAGEARVLNGALLRVDKATGLAAPDNPFVVSGSADENERRILGYGLRNPFRMAVRPGGNQVWIADVGWSSWEELNVVPDLASARNFGWPCREGPSAEYFGLNICPPAAATTPAFFAYAHDAPAVPNDGCELGSSAIAGLAFHAGGSNYPDAYENALFFSDYSRRCLWVMFADGEGDPNPEAAAPFASSALGPVDLQIGADGNLYYVDFDGGRVMRVGYGLHAEASANPTSGPIPLTVQFDSAGSLPASPGDTLSFAWDLDGDGQFDDSAEAQPLREYTTAATTSVRLRVTDGQGGFADSDPVVISAGNEAPTATILTPASSLAWKVGDTIAFAGVGSDPQDGELPPSALDWEVVIHHCPSNCHEHTYQTFSGVASGSFAAPDHEYPMFLEVRLTAEDSASLTSTASVHVSPQTVALDFVSIPPGLQLSSGTLTRAAPFTQTVVVGSQNTIIAPSPQGAYPTILEFGSWSDGGEPSHTITAPESPWTLTATFASHADLSIAMTAAPETICGGLPITYTLEVANAGPSRAVAVSVVDTLPDGASFVSAEGAGWTCSGGAEVLCTAAALDLGPAPPIAIVAAAPTTPGQSQNAASVGSATNDLFGADNQAQASTDVQPGIEIPVITAPGSAEIGALELEASVEDHPGSTYAWALAPGTITTGQGTSRITFDAAEPGSRMQLLLVETDASCDSPLARFALAVDFLDVPPPHAFHEFVSRVAREGITVGCGGGRYCPESSVSRAQMAVFLLRSKLGESYVPPPATGEVFADVPASDPYAPWIEELAALGVTGGCGSGNYCPAAVVTRAQMAVFLLKAKEGSAYVPPTAAGVFSDVPANDPFSSWIEDLYARKITEGCSASPLLYCPGNPNTRGQMAVFLVTTFGL